MAGVSLVVLSLLTMWLIISGGLSRALIFAAAANTLVGVTFILTSMEHKILFPKKFLHITDEAIEFKLGGFFRERRIEWDSVTRISDEGKTVHIYSGDKVIKINMLHFPSSDEKQIKASLSAFAEARHI